MRSASVLRSARYPDAQQAWADGRIIEGTAEDISEIAQEILHAQGEL